MTEVSVAGCWCHPFTFLKGYEHLPGKKKKTFSFHLVRTMTDCQRGPSVWPTFTWGQMSGFYRAFGWVPIHSWSCDSDTNYRGCLTSLSGLLQKNPNKCKRNRRRWSLWHNGTGSTSQMFKAVLKSWMMFLSESTWIWYICSSSTAE